MTGFRIRCVAGSTERTESWRADLAWCGQREGRCGRQGSSGWPE